MSSSDRRLRPMTKGQRVAYLRARNLNPEKAEAIRKMFGLLYEKAMEPRSEDNPTGYPPIK